MRRHRGILICILAFILILPLGGCGVKVSTKSPEAVVKSMLQAYQEGDEEAVGKCFGLDSKKKTAEEISQEIGYNIKIFKAHEAENIKFKKCESLGNFNGYNLVYAIYNFEIKEKDSDTLEIPSVSMYFVQKKEKKYYIVPAKDVSEDMSKISSEEFSKFMKTDEYKSYEKDYKKFVRMNPDYEANLANKMEELSK